MNVDLSDDKTPEVGDRCRFDHQILGEQVGTLAGMYDEETYRFDVGDPMAYLLCDPEDVIEVVK